MSNLEMSQIGDESSASDEGDKSCSSSSLGDDARVLTNYHEALKMPKYHYYWYTANQHRTLEEAYREHSTISPRVQEELTKSFVLSKAMIQQWVKNRKDMEGQQCATRKRMVPEDSLQHSPEAGGIHDLIQQYEPLQHEPEIGPDSHGQMCRNCIAAMETKKPYQNLGVSVDGRRVCRNSGDSLKTTPTATKRRNDGKSKGTKDTIYVMRRMEDKHKTAESPGWPTTTNATGIETGDMMPEGNMSTSTDISLDDYSDGSLPRPIIKMDTRPPKSRPALIRNRVNSLDESSLKPSPNMGRRHSQSRVTFTPPPSAMGPVRFCLICPNPHDTRVCPAPFSFQQRIKILVVEQNRCPVCLRADNHGTCRTEPCLYCLSENHHSALCQQRY